MKTHIVLVSVLLGLNMVSAKEKTKTSLTKNPKATSLPPTALSTDIRFSDQSVGGKYQLPMEALSVVENEKSIDNLIGIRKNFRDRIGRTKGMR